MALIKQQWWGAAWLAATLALSGCAPLASNSGAGAAQGASGTAPAAGLRPAPPAAAGPGAAGMQDIVVGAAPGRRVELQVKPPAQVCDFNAFADGVRYGYASTWNGEVGHPAVLAKEGAPAGASASATPPRTMFDPATVQSKDQQYIIQWGSGSQPKNACATYGYQIGKVVGAHRAYVDLRTGAPS